MFIAALQTARMGSLGVPGKNTLPVRGEPLFTHNLRAALATPEITEVYCSTDDPAIAQWARRHGVFPIDRPAELCGPDASHHDTILHGLAHIEGEIGELDALVILLGNAAGATPEDLSTAIRMLEADPRADSIESVSPFPMFNPFRALCRSEDGTLQTILPQQWIAQRSRGLTNDRNDAGEVLFFNGSFWVVRRAALVRRDGLLPFPWLGRRILAYVQSPRMELDAPWQNTMLREPWE